MNMPMKRGGMKDSENPSVAFSESRITQIESHSKEGIGTRKTLFDRGVGFLL